MTDLSRKDIGTIADALGSDNRGNDIAGSSSDPQPFVITLERINDILINYLDTRINPSINQNGNQYKVPIIYGTPERWESVRKTGYIRDTNSSKILAPLIMIKRESERQGALHNPVNKYMHRTLDLGWNARNAYDKFAVQNGIRPSQKLMSVMVPDYMDLEYNMVLWADQQEQLDAMIEQINVEADEFWGERNDFKFRVSIDGFSSVGDLPTDGDRVVRSQAKMVIKAYLLPAKVLRNYTMAPTQQVHYGAKKTVMFFEIAGHIQTPFITAPPEAFTFGSGSAVFGDSYFGVDYFGNFYFR